MDHGCWNYLWFCPEGNHNQIIGGTDFYCYLKSKSCPRQRLQRATFIFGCFLATKTLHCGKGWPLATAGVVVAFDYLSICSVRILKYSGVMSGMCTIAWDWAKKSVDAHIVDKTHLEGREMEVVGGSHLARLAQMQPGFGLNWNWYIFAFTLHTWYG